MPGNDRTTPEIVLSMMEDFSVPLEDVKAYSYVAVASGTKRHNMAKVYAGFYKYDDSTVPPEKQQRVQLLPLLNVVLQRSRSPLNQEIGANVTPKLS